MFQLEPVTAAGRKFVDLAEQHAEEVAAQAATNDADRRFPVDVVESMKASGFTAAMVPERFGGLGASSLHDLAVAVSRLARGDGSIAIAINMHFASCVVTEWLHRSALARDDETAVAGTEAYLSFLGGGGIAMANATEAGTNISWPLTEATRVEGGWSITGRKIFGTLSPVADSMAVTCRYHRDDGTWGAGTAIVFKGSPGHTVLDNWDALGMRASGSHDVVYDGCFVPDGMFLQGPDWGSQSTQSLLIATGGTIGLAAAFLGIAESARAHVVPLLRTRTKQPTGQPMSTQRNVQRLVAECESKIVTGVGMLDWIGRHVDALVLDTPTEEQTLEAFHELNGRFQAVKLVVTRAAIDAVDAAMQATGGAGYLASSPLGRLYRDVRAGPFMQPISATDAHEYIGKVVLGEPPIVEP